MKKVKEIMDIVMVCMMITSMWDSIVIGVSNTILGNKLAKIGLLTSEIEIVLEDEIIWTSLAMIVMLVIYFVWIEVSDRES